MDLGSGESRNYNSKGDNLANGKGLGFYIIGGRNDLEDKRVIENDSEQEDTGKKNVHGTVRGVDVIRNGKIILRDANERNCGTVSIHTVI